MLQTLQMVQGWFKAHDEDKIMLVVSRVVVNSGFELWMKLSKMDCGSRSIRKTGERLP